MTHPEMNELYELYVLGTLEPELAAEIEMHLEQQCEYCNQRLGEAALVAAAMSGMAEEQEPPKQLRARVLASVAPPKRSANWLYGLAAAACVALAIYSFSLNRQISALTAQRDQLRSAVEVLSRPGTRMVQFGAPSAPQGRVFLSHNGLVFAGSELPQLANDKTFQLWLIPAQGAPQSAGIFRANPAGSFVNVVPGPIDLSKIQAVAVSVEPSQGSPAPTTKPILIVAVT